MNPRRILALDPATLTGFCLRDAVNREYGRWLLPKGEIGPKLAALEDHILDTVRAYGVTEIAYELASYGAGGRKGEGGPQWKTIVVHNQLRSIIDKVASQLGLKVWKYHPSSIKLFACINGRAKKDQVKRACETRLGCKPADDNESDAIWLAEMGFEQYEPPAAKERRVAKAVKAARKREPTLFPMGRARQVRR